jgi:hypothetical protein
VYFAGNGFPFLAVDVRGRGNSEGTFRPFAHEGQDGFDVTEWLAHQRFCDGQVAMWGGSYGGYVQWATAGECPRHLATIVPAASVCPGVDFPIRKNITKPYIMQWLTFVSGRTVQDKIFADQEFWGAQFRAWFESGTSLRKLDAFLGNTSEIFQEWVAHPEQGPYWDCYRPKREQYTALRVPVLTITGLYDADQLGALTYYREHLESAPESARVQHYLVIGPWDHAGTRDPKLEFAGLQVGLASLVDLAKLHLEWYAWTMRGGPRPEFLRKRIAYYVIGAEEWRYADRLGELAARSDALYLDSRARGTLGPERPSGCAPDEYVHDPRDVSLAAIECGVDPANVVDQRMLHARIGRELIYHSAPFEGDTEIIGFFRLEVWLAIDQPDTDVRASVYEVALDGSSVLLTSDSIRARYREGLREARLIRTSEPLRYEFDGFMLVARRVRKGHRLRLVIGPIHSIYAQKNYQCGGVVAEETAEHARIVTVRLFHDAMHPSVLHVPIGRAAGASAGCARVRDPDEERPCI